MSIPLGLSNFSSAAQLVPVKISPINQTRDATWVHMFNYYANDGHENCMMMIKQNHRSLIHMTKMKMVTLSSSLFSNLKSRGPPGPDF